MDSILGFLKDQDINSYWTVWLSFGYWIGLDLDFGFGLRLDIGLLINQLLTQN